MLARIVKMKVYLFCLSAVVLLLGLSACSSVQTQFNHLPRAEADFNLSLHELEQRYRDVTFFSGSGLFNLHKGKLNALKKQWGEPDKVVTRWGLQGGLYSLGLATVIIDPAQLLLQIALNAVINPLPLECLYWRKGDSQIVAKVSRKILSGYQRMVYDMQWRKCDARDTKVCIAVEHGK